MLEAKTFTAVTTPTLLSLPNAALIRNNGTDTVYFGGPNVTADTTATGGFQLASGEKLQVNDAEDVYFVIASGKSATITVLS